MFVRYCLSEVSEVDIALSQVNVLLAEVNTKLSKCPFIPKKDLLSRISPILSEIKWTVYLTQEKVECDQSISDVGEEDDKSLAWDSGEDFNLYEEDDGDDEKSSEDDDHGPIKFSDSESDDEVFPPHPSLLHPESKSGLKLHVESKEDFVNFIVVKKEMGLIRGQKALPATKLLAPEWGPPLPVSSDEDHENISEGQSESVPPAEDDCAKFVKEMSEKINLLASEGKYKVVRPIKYGIDLTKVNKFFMRNIPNPESFPIQGCSQDPAFYDREGARRDRDGFYVTSSPNHYKDYPRPHGSLFGYKTDMGIVPVPEEAVNGYVWQNNDWILHAVVDDGTGTPSRGSWSPQWKRRGG